MTAADPRELPPPPDGAPLASLEVRREWLSRIEVVYALPRVGVLWMPDGPTGARVAFDLSSIRAIDPDGAEREQPVDPASVERFVDAWRAAWLGPLADTVVGLLHYRGLLRTVGSHGGRALEAWLASALRS